MTVSEKWMIISHPGNYVEMGRKYGISPVIARIIRNRGLVEDGDIRDFLNKDPGRLSSPCFSGHNLQDMDRAVKLTAEKIREGKKIRIIGDYDIDGISSVYILEKGIGKADGRVDHYIPKRVRDGYGLNAGIITEAKEDGTDTIITCDNGIAAFDEIKLAKSLGMTVIVTDHHEIPFHFEGEERMEDLPCADAVVDPHREDCDYAFKSICGAVVAYKLILCLYEEMGIDLKEAEEFLEIAAFATIGDVMPLLGENRILVEEGLRRLERTENPGLKSLISLCQLEGKSLSPFHVGFILGPCLNAAGRLDDAEDALKLLLSEGGNDSRGKALSLKEMNEERKSMTEKSTEKALEIAGSSEYGNDTVLVICLEDCHESIAGIVAGRVRERTGRPAFILTPGSTPEGEECFKGSGRSIPGYHMFEEMSRIKELFLRFGGHAMAAGLSIKKENAGELRRRLNMNSPLTEEDIKIRVDIDMELPFSLINEELIEKLEILKPFGTGNARPVFAARNVSIENLRIFGKTNNVLKGRVSDGTGVSFDSVYFGEDASEKKDLIEELQRSGKKLKMVFSPEINEYQRKRSIQIIIERLKA